MKWRLLLWTVGVLGAQAPKAKPVAGAFAEVSRQALAAREANRPAEALALLRRALSLNPRWTEGWWSLGTLHYEQDEHVACRDAFRRLVVLDKTEAPPFALLGLCEFRLKEYGAALKHLDEARRLGMPSEVQLAQVAIFHLGQLLTKVGNYERALQLYTQLSRTAADSPELVVGTGLAALRRPLLPDEMDPEDRDLVIRIGRATLLALQRRPQEAEALFEAIVADYPKEPNVHYLYGGFLLISKPDEGIRAFEKELALNPEHLPALVTLAMEYLKRGDADAARPYAERGVLAGPGNFAAHAALGRVHLEQGRTAAAVKELQLAKQLAPDSPQVRFYLASAYAKAGQKTLAAQERAAFQKLRGETEGSNP